MTLPPPPRAITPPPSRVAATQAQPQGNKIITIGVRQPRPIVPRMVIYAVEKFGKTSLAAHAPNPAILMCRDNGYDTLLSAGRVPAVPAADINSFPELLDTVRGIAKNPADRKTLVIDGLTGAERLCHEHVCNTVFDGDWGERGFASFQKGYDLSATEWLKLILALDMVRDAGIAVVILAHARQKSVKNPLGADYDRFEPDCHAKTWGPTAKWADAILFGKMHTIVEVDRRAARMKIAEQKGKAIGGTDRVLFSEPHDAWVAGNRYGMESEIWMQDTPPEGMYQRVIDSIKKPAA